MTDSQGPPDDILVTQIAAGDEAAFLALYRRRQAGIFRFAWQMSGSRAVAQDVTQDVFVALLRQARDFDPSRGSVAAYLFGIARNVLRRRARSREPEAEEIGDLKEAAEPAAAGDPATDLMRRESVDLVRRAIAALPAHYREVVVLCEIEELTYGEVAATLGQPVGTIRSRLHRARALLARKLEARAGRTALDIGDVSPRWSS